MTAAAQLIRWCFPNKQDRRNGKAEFFPDGHHLACRRVFGTGIADDVEAVVEGVQRLCMA